MSWLCACEQAPAQALPSSLVATQQKTSEEAKTVKTEGRAELARAMPRCILCSLKAKTPFASLTKRTKAAHHVNSLLYDGVNFFSAERGVFATMMSEFQYETVLGLWLVQEPVLLCTKPEGQDVGP